jgi:two-component system, chemotaxis family, protein-glutamate methylesterase/glutaminase
MFEAAVVGVSAGGMRALQTIIPALPANFPVPIVVVQHVSPHGDTYLCDHLARISAITVKEAEEKEVLSPATAYLAPPGYHLLIEPDRSLSLSVDEKVNFSRPAIDLLFESAAEAFGPGLIGIVLTGANADGALGLRAIKRHGGLAIAQNPKTAEAPYMPAAAIEATQVDFIENLDGIASLLVRLCEGESRDVGAQG